MMVRVLVAALCVPVVAAVTATHTITLPTETETVTVTEPTGTETVTTTVTVGTLTTTETLPTGTASESVSVTAPTGTETVTVSLPTGTSSESVSVTVPTGTETETTTVSLATGTASMTVTESLTDTGTKTGSATVTLPTGTETISTTVTLPTGTATATETISESTTVTLPTGTETHTVTTTLPTGTDTVSTTMSLPTGTETHSTTFTVPTGTDTVTTTISLPTGTETHTTTATLPTGTETVSQTLTESVSLTMDTRTETITLPTRTETHTQDQALPIWEPFWYYQGPFPTTVINVYPTEVVQSDVTTFAFTGYKAEEGLPVVFLRSPEAGARSYNICAELLPNTDWAVESMNKLGVTHQLTETLNNGTQAFHVAVDYYQREDLVIDTRSLESDQVGAWHTAEAVPYYVCVRPDDNGWNALATQVWVKQENATEPLYGYQSCEQLMAAHTEFCGCYLSVGVYSSDDNQPSRVTGRTAGWVNVDTTYPTNLLLDIDVRSRYRSGCCASLPVESSALTKDYPVEAVLSSSGSYLARSWGTCATSDQSYKASVVY